MVILNLITFTYIISVQSLNPWGMLYMFWLIKTTFLMFVKES